MTCSGVGELAKEQLNAVRAWEWGASASTKSVANLQAAAGCLKIALPTSLLLFIFILKAHSIGMYVLLGVHHHKALALSEHVTRVLNMATVLLKEQMKARFLPIYLIWEIQAADTFWILKNENSDVMILSLEHGQPLDNIDVAKYSPIRLLAEFELALYSPG